MNPKIILLDWDGTIVDIFHHVHQAMNQTLEAYHKKPWDNVTAATQIGRPDGEKFPEIFGGDWQQALEFFYRANAEIAKDWEKPDLTVGAEAFISYLQGRRMDGVKVGIVSNKPAEIILKEIQQLGWNGFFDVVIGYDDKVMNKPSPDALSRALAGLSLVKEPVHSDILYVGDTNTDCEFARNTGMRFVGVGDKINLPLDDTERVDNLLVLQKRMRLAEKHQTRKL